MGCEWGRWVLTAVLYGTEACSERNCGGDEVTSAAAAVVVVAFLLHSVVDLLFAELFLKSVMLLVRV